jgi:hypothetical protein
MTTTGASVILDERGEAMFHCRICHAAMTIDDFFELGLRLPDRGEGVEEYCDAELLDRVEHQACANGARESRAG